MRLVLPTCACLLLAPRLVHAGPSEASAAQALFDDAKVLMNRGDYSAACPKLEESQRLDPALGTLLNLADCREKEGNVATAWSAFRDAEGMARREGKTDAEEVARSRAQALAARVPRLVVDVTAGQPEGFRLTRNGVDVGAPQWGAAIPLDPGQYELVASAPGYDQFRAVAALKDGGGAVKISVPLLRRKAVPNQPAPSAPRANLASEEKPAERGGAFVPTASWILGGIGVGALGTSLAFGAWANSQYDAADCPDHTCTNADELAERDAARTKAVASTILFAAGAAALVGGITVWALTPRNAEPALAVHSVELRAGLGSLSVSGAW